MGVAEADLFVGLGSFAWLFSISTSGTTIGDSRAGLDVKHRLNEAGESVSRRGSCSSDSTTLFEILESDQGPASPPLEDDAISKTKHRRSSDDSGLGAESGTSLWKQHSNDSALSLSLESKTLHGVCSRMSSTNLRSSIAESLDVSYVKESLAEVALDEEVDLIVPRAR